ncbi:unnamed protein product [Pieris macdunnoughi]|uniref:gamma-glutamylcyclotransferase n=1 Tax=Pieris macdunnoughi TaxID=345717 RepID=A0A821NW52_9NEOP|nr:unnamed protein product [Pieris macdunnoughi]
MHCNRNLLERAMNTQREIYRKQIGRNLLKTRLRINAPSAVFITPARLPGYRLDFDNYSPNWRGAPATIAAIPKSEVWGALWLLNYSEMGALDEQEGLKDGLYEAIDVKVLNLNNHVITARSYKMTSDPPKVHPEVLPLQRRPSNTYIQVIALGAYQCGIPSYYIEFIYRFPTNGRTATDKLSQELGYPFNENIQISLKYFFVFLKNNNGPFITSFGTTRYLC